MLTVLFLGTISLLYVMCRKSLHVALAYFGHFRSENLPFHNTSFETSLQMLLLVVMLGRNAAQPRNGTSLLISICPEKMTTFSSSGGFLAVGLRLSYFQPLPFLCRLACLGGELCSGSLWSSKKSVWR